MILICFVLFFSNLFVFFSCCSTPMPTLSDTSYLKTLHLEISSYQLYRVLMQNKHISFFYVTTNSKEKKESPCCRISCWAMGGAPLLSIPFLCPQKKANTNWIFKSSILNSSLLEAQIVEIFFFFLRNKSEPVGTSETTLYNQRVNFLYV